MAAETQGSAAGQRGGLFDSLKTLAGTLLAIGRTRLELLSNELEEERLRLGSILLWASVALFFAALGTVLATLLFVTALWDEHRLLALGIPTLLFMLGALLSFRTALDKIRSKRRLFSASLAELTKDCEQLASRP